MSIVREANFRDPASMAVLCCENCGTVAPEDAQDWLWAERGEHYCENCRDEYEQGAETDYIYDTLREG